MKRKILCFGDSLTKGRPGTTYLKYVKNKKQYNNKGLCGDTLIGMTKRLEAALQNPNYQDATDIIVGIGANDVLQPFLKNYSKLWSLRIKSLVKRGSVACQDEHQFKEEYLKLLNILKNTKKNIVIFSIPYIENFNYEINEKIIIYNKIIKYLCEKSNITYLDYYSWQKNEKHNLKNTASSFMSRNPLLVGVDTFLTNYLPFTDYISKRRGLVLTVDGCHSNSYAAKNLAQMIEKNI